MDSGGNIIEIAGGSITEIFKGDYDIYGENIQSLAAKSVHEEGHEMGKIHGSPQQAPVLENKNFIASIEFYRSLDQSNGKFGKDDTSYHGEIGFDRFDKSVCAEGLIGEYETLAGVLPTNDAVRGIKRYLCPFLSIWPPALDAAKSKVTLYVKADPCTIASPNDTAVVEFTSSDPAVLSISGNSKLNLKIGAVAQPLQIECKAEFSSPVYITAMAVSEPVQTLGRLVVCPSTSYTTVIQPVEIKFAAAKSNKIVEVAHEQFMNTLLTSFNNKSFNQANIRAELAPKTNQITLELKEFKDKGLLSNLSDGNLYLKKDSESDPSTIKYNKLIEERYAAFLSNEGAKQELKEKMVEKMRLFVKEFNKNYSYKKSQNLEYTKKQYENDIATKAWNIPKVVEAFTGFSNAEIEYKAAGGDQVMLEKIKTLHLFYSHDIHAAKNETDKVLAYSHPGSGVVHVFDEAFKNSDAYGVVLHEFGHCLGLSHTFNSDLGDYAEREPNKRYREDIEAEINKKNVDRNSLVNKRKELVIGQKSGKDQGYLDRLNDLNITYNKIEFFLEVDRSYEEFCEHFLPAFIADKNTYSLNILLAEQLPLEFPTLGTHKNIEQIDFEIEVLNKELSKLELEKKSAERIKKYNKVKVERGTKENYMDYDLERKSFYQWQWKEMKGKGIQFQYVIPLK